MKRKNLLLVFMVLLFLPALSFALPHLAVLDAVLDAGIDPSAGPLVTSKIEEAFVNSGKYVVLDRANIDRVLEEKEFQLSSGIVRNEEVRRAGEYLGADAVVVASVSRIGQTYVVSAKMIDVVSGEIAAQTSAEKAGRIDVLLEVARMVGGRLAGTDIFIVSVDEQRAQEVVRDEPKEKSPAEETEVVEEPEMVEEEEEAYVAAPSAGRPWDKRFIVGVRGGVNFANISWDDYHVIWAGTLSDVSEPYGTGGVNGGVYVVFNSSRYLGWVLEMDLSQKGYGVDLQEDWTWDLTETFKYNYLEIPMLAKVRIPGMFSPYGVLGIYISMWLNGLVTKEYWDIDADQEGDPEDFFSYNSIDAGWVAGLGLDVYLGSLVLNAELKYSGGFLWVTDDDIYKNAALTVTAGVGWAF